MFYSNQFGFRKNYSTELLLTLIHDNIINAVENKSIAMGVFLDLSKAFDMVNHSILLSKMEKYGIRGLVLDWFKSYLSGRKQCVKIKDTVSPLANMEVGVPQGSILGPLLFLIYINDIGSVSSRIDTFLFADDTNLFSFNSNPNSLLELFNQELPKLHHWFNVNKLLLNIKKSSYILFSPHHNLSHLDLNQLTINSIILPQSSQIKFLGVIFDNKLTFKAHINYISTKISKNLGILFKIRRYLNLNTRIKLYYALIYPFLLYGICIWGSVYKTRLDILFKLQKRCIRFIFNLSYIAHTTNFFKDYNILTVYQLYIFRILTLAYKFFVNALPTNFQNFFSLCTRPYARRRAHLLNIQPSRTNLKRYSPSCLGPHLWNSLPTDIKMLPYLSLFVNSSRSYLINNCITEINTLEGVYY